MGSPNKRFAKLVNCCHLLTNGGKRWVHFEASLDLQILFITTPIGQWGEGEAESFIPDSHSLLVEPFIEGKTHSVTSSCYVSGVKCGLLETQPRAGKTAWRESKDLSLERRIHVESWV